MDSQSIGQIFESLGNTQEPELYSTSGSDDRIKAKKTRYEQAYAAYNANQQDYRNYLLAEYGYNKQQEQADLEYERNSPAAQKARMLAAGYNPTLSNVSDSGYTAATYSQPSASARANVEGPQYQTFTEKLAKVNGVIGTLNQAVGLQTQQLQNDILKQNIFRNAQVNQREEINTLDTLLHKGWMKDSDRYESIRNFVGSFKEEQEFMDASTDFYNSRYAQADAVARHNFYSTERNYIPDYDLARLEKRYQDDYDALLSRKPNRDLDLGIKDESYQSARANGRFRKEAQKYLDDHSDMPVELRILLLGALNGLSNKFNL